MANKIGAEDATVPRPHMEATYALEIRQRNNPVEVEVLVQVMCQDLCLQLCDVFQ